MRKTRIMFYCDECDKKIVNEKATSVNNGNCVCKKCLEKYFVLCPICKKYDYKELVKKLDQFNKVACMECRRKEKEKTNEKF